MRRAALLYGAGLALLIGGAFPFFWMLSTALKPSGEIFATPPALIPLHPTLENFRRLFAETYFLGFVRNSAAPSRHPHHERIAQQHHLKIVACGTCKKLQAETSEPA